jgi:hypothetical protein
MRVPILAGLSSIILLPGCVPYEGSYSPDCVAYEGSKIVLNDGQFTWQKFSDQVFMNNDGEIVNQFSDYPKTGTYRVDGQSVYMESDTGETMPGMYLVPRDKRHYLLTAAQFAELKKSGAYPKCALVLEVNAAN